MPAMAWTRSASATETEVAELKDGEIRRYSIRPEDFGLPRAGLDAIRVTGPGRQPGACCAACWLASPGPARDIVLLNAGRGHLCGGPGRQPGGRGAAGGCRHRERRGRGDRFERLVALTQGFAIRACTGPRQRTSMAETPDILKKICIARWRRCAPGPRACR